MTRILIVEDDHMAQKLLEIYLERNPEYHLVASIDCAAMAEVYCAANEVDVILMDVCTAMGASGLDAAEKIKKHAPYIKIIIITSQPECSFIDRARAAGVDSFWYKSATAEDLMEVLRRTLEGESLYPDSTPRLKLGNTFSSELTDRELEVLRELTAGEPDAVIAERLHMSVRTVKAHIQSMRDKTGFRNRTELAVRAIESGLVMSQPKEEE